MKKISVIVILTMLPCIAGAARYSNPYKMNNYKSNKELQLAKTRTVNTPSESKFYVGIHADLSLLSWKNEYKSDGVDAGSEKFKMKTFGGADVDFGYKFNEKWSAELELGYGGKYSRTEDFSTDKTKYNLSVMYFGVNGFYNIYKGIYAGIGTGGAVVKSSIEYNLGTKYKGSKTEISPMGALMLGYKYDVNEHLGIDFRYRFSAFNGPKFGFNAAGTDVDIKTGLITNHTVSLGIKYGF